VKRRTVAWGLSVLVLLTGAAHAAEQPVRLNMWAAAATDEDRAETWLDPGLEPIAPAVRDLPFDTFRGLHTASPECRLQTTTRIKVHDDYAVALTPLACEDDGTVRLRVTIEKQPPRRDAEPLRVLRAVVKLAPGKMVKLGGAAVDGGELVVVLALPARD